MLRFKHNDNTYQKLKFKIKRTLKYCKGYSGLGHFFDSKVQGNDIGKCYILELSLAGGAQRVLPEENLSLF